MKINCSLKKNMLKSQCSRKPVGEAMYIMILPKGDNSGRKIKVERYGKYIDKINSRFGGSTIKPIKLGCWKDGKRNKMQCEAGFSVETWRDFDADEKMKRYNSIKRRHQLNSDFSYMKGLAKESAEEFGQAFVPVVYDELNDVTLMKGNWQKKLPNSMIKGKIQKDLFGKNI